MGTFTDTARKNFEINLSFGNFRDEDDFFDVTLAAVSPNGSIEALRAHKLILSACSPVLRSLLKEQSRLSGNNQTTSFMLYLRGISAKGLSHVLDFVYRGSISLAQDELDDFLAVGESLQIPLMERSTPGPAKRALIPNNRKKSKRARVVQDGIEEGLTESDPSLLPDSSLTMKPDPGTPTVYDRRMYEEDINNRSDEDLYEEDVDLDAFKEGNTFEAEEESVVDTFKIAQAVIENIPGRGELDREHADDSDRGREDVERNGKEYILAEIQEGKRRGSVNYLIRNKLYLKDFIYKIQINASCTKRQKGCRGRAVICKDTLMVLKETAHSCGTDQTDVAVLHLENKMKKMAEETSLRIRQIFDQVSLENPEAAAKIAFSEWSLP